MRIIDIGIFAHNEQNTIESIIKDLSKQNILKENNTTLRINVLCNGCTDQTVAIAKLALDKYELNSITRLEDFQTAGKSTTWNRFIDNLPYNSQFVIFMDGDIRIKDTSSISNLVNDLQQSSALAMTSRPIKDLRRLQRNPFLLIAANFINSEHRNGSICGQFYAVKTKAIRQIRLPVPCLVEDGFLAACLITDCFTNDGNPDRILASMNVNHYFLTPKRLIDFFHHDVRLSLGRELNAALYSALWAAESIEKKLDIMKQFSKSIGIDSSIDVHQEHPERSALAKHISFRKLLRNKNEPAISKITRLPFRLAHLLYMSIVQRYAKRLFMKKIFLW